MGSQLRAQGGGAAVLLPSAICVNCEDLVQKLSYASGLFFFVSRADSFLMLALCSDSYHAMILIIHHDRRSLCLTSDVLLCG